jgi:hypothetical protein
LLLHVAAEILVTLGRGSMDLQRWWVPALGGLPLQAPQITAFTHSANKGAGLNQFYRMEDACGKHATALTEQTSKLSMALHAG